MRPRHGKERLAQQHLERLRQAQVHLAQVPSECVVRFGEPKEEILAEAEAFDTDLIAVMTRCRSGRTLLGSVAEQVLRKASTAVILVRPAVRARDLSCAA